MSDGVNGVSCPVLETKHMKKGFFFHMFYKDDIFMKLPSLSSLLSFQIVLYKGSHIRENNYLPLVHGLQSRLSDLNASVTVGDSSFFRRREFTEDTIVIGHSLGGYFALLDTLYDQKRQKNVKGVVLLYSHFNSQRKAWYYPGVSQDLIQAPVFTIAGGQDQRLSLTHVLPDFWEKQEKRIPDKFYKIYPQFSHFSGVNGTLDQETISLINDVENFVRGIHHHQIRAVMTPHCFPSESMYSYRDPSLKIPHSINYKKSINVLDAFFSIVLKSFFWEWIHHVLFLVDRPSVHKNVVFTDYGDHIMIKSYNLDLETILKLCKESLPDAFQAKIHIIRLPRNLWGLYQWLLYPLVLQTLRIDENTYQWPMLMLPIRKHVCYYKILHPRQIILKQIRDQKDMKNQS